MLQNQGNVKPGCCRFLPVPEPYLCWRSHRHVFATETAVPATADAVRKLS